MMRGDTYWVSTGFLDEFVIIGNNALLAFELSVAQQVLQLTDRREIRSGM